jgi:hypothetical protein
MELTDAGNFPAAFAIIPIVPVAALSFLKISSGRESAVELCIQAALEEVGKQGSN